MPLSYSEKTKILDSYNQLTKRHVKPDKTTYYLSGSKTKRKAIIRDLRDTGNGYIYAGYLEDYKDIIDERGFVNIDYSINNETEFRALIDRVINSFI